MEKFVGCYVFKVDFGSYNYRYVVAKTFDEAAEKGKKYMEHERQIDESILDYDGSLKETSKEIKVKSVEKLSDELIF